MVAAAVSDRAPSSSSRRLPALPPFAAQLALCCLLYAGAVAFGVYAFFGRLGNLYVLHFGNAVAVVCMNAQLQRGQWRRWASRSAATAAVCYAAYAAVRLRTVTLPHVAVVGALNAVEQLLTSALLLRTLPLASADVYQSFRFIATLLAASTLLPLPFAIAGSLALQQLYSRVFSRTLLTYFFSHASGTYLGLYTYYVLRGGLRLRQCPFTLRYLYDTAAVALLAGALNSLTEYSIFRNAAIIACFPLMAYLAAQYSQAWTALAELAVLIIIFACVMAGRGPYMSPSGDLLATVTSLYVLLLCSALMSALLSLVMLQRRQAYAAVTELKDDIYFVSSQVSHDVRGPITHIMDVCGSVRSGTHTGADLADLQYSCETVADIMDSWLVMLHSSEGGPVTSAGGGGALVLGAVTDVVLTAFFHKLLLYGQRAIRASGKERLSIALEGLRDLPVQSLAINSKLLHHVLVNFVSNAVKYSNAGMITVHVAVAPSGSSLRVTVQDQGMGIAPQHLPRICERFYRVEEQQQASSVKPPTALTSHGVGLNIAKTLVAKMGGTLQVDSKLGLGSKFTVTVPAAPAQAPSADAAAVQLADLTVLMAEDNLVLIRLYSRWLTECKSVKVAADGARVLPLLQEGPAPDVLLLDQSLPSRSGTEILHEMLASQPSALRAYSRLAIVTISGSDCFTSADWAPLTVRHCHKPFTHAELKQCMRQAVVQQRQANGEGGSHSRSSSGDSRHNNSPV